MAFSNAERDRLYDLLPAFIRERDQQSGEGLRGAPRRRRSPGRCHRGGYPAAPGRRLHRNLRAVGRRLYRRSRRHDAAVRRKPRVKDGDTAVELFRDLVGAEDRRIKALHGRADRSLPGRGLRPFVALRSRADVAKTIYYPPAQGHAAHARGAGARRHRLAGACGRVFRTPRLDAVGAQSPALPFAAHARHPFGRAHGPAQRRLRRDRAHRRCAADLPGRGLVQHPQHRLPSCGGSMPMRSNDTKRGVSARPETSATSSARLAIPRQLFSRARREGDEAGLATELHVPQPIRPARFFTGIADFYGSVPNASSITVFVDGVEIPAAQVICRNLSIWSQPPTDFDRHRRGARPPDARPEPGCRRTRSRSPITTAFPPISAAAPIAAAPG